jgi:hypothetical protein
MDAAVKGGISQLRRRKNPTWRGGSQMPSDVATSVPLT